MSQGNQSYQNGNYLEIIQGPEDAPLSLQQSAVCLEKPEKQVQKNQRIFYQLTHHISRKNKQIIRAYTDHKCKKSTTLINKTLQVADTHLSQALQLVQRPKQRESMGSIEQVDQSLSWFDEEDSLLQNLQNLIEYGLSQQNSQKLEISHQMSNFFGQVIEVEVQPSCSDQSDFRFQEFYMQTYELYKYKDIRF